MVQGGQWGVVVAAVQTCSAVTCARGRTPGRCACLLRAWLAMAWPLPRSAVFFAFWPFLQKKFTNRSLAKHFLAIDPRVGAMVCGAEL